MRLNRLKRIFSFLLAAAIVFSGFPISSIAATGENGSVDSAEDPFRGKTLSILGDSISTFQNYSNGTAAETTNSTIGSGAIYYPRSGFEVTAESTWWYQAAQMLGLELLVNNSWSGSCLLNTRSGTVGAYVDRCVQLHDDTGDNAGQKPDIIAIFLGTNDYYTYPSTLGSYEAIDFDTLILSGADGYSYAQPVTSLEAYAITLHKIRQAYPDADVYCFTLLPRANSVSQPTDFNADVCQLAQHFGVYTVDLHDCGIRSDSEAFYMLMGDSLHPDNPGMDAITNAFVSALLKNSAQTTFDISFSLEDAVAMEGTTRTVVSGSGFETNLAALDASLPLEITVTMGGADITESCRTGNAVKIPSVTADVVITAKPGQREPMNFRWEMKEDAFVSVTTGGNAENALTMTHGTITDGTFSKTRFTLSQGICLRHDLPWCVEWKSEGTWTDTTDGALLFSEATSSSTADACYFYRRHNNDFFAFGSNTGGKYHNYGVKLAGTGIDTTANHVFRLENRIGEDGANMVYLFIDGEEIGPLNHHWIGGTDQKETVDWVSGKDFTFSYMGTTPHTIGGCRLEYVQVWENGEPIDYEGKTVSILGDSISTYQGVSNNPSSNASIGGNAVYYNAGTLGVYRPDTWWQQVIDTMGMELLVNNSWSGSCVLTARAGTAGAYADRCVQLHNADGEEPDVILLFLGTNDFSYFQDTLGSAEAIDYDALITQNDDGTFTYAAPTTACEAYAIMLHKMAHRYPNAKVLCLLPTARRSPDYADSFADVGQPTVFNGSLTAVARRFGCTVVDLENCGIAADSTVFDSYMGDKRVHPNALGMDKISEAVISSLLKKQTEIYDISFDLTNVTGEGAHAVLPGASYTVNLAEAEGFRSMAVSVTMGGQNVTEACYANGVVSIPSVTGDVVITAYTIDRDPMSFRWEFDGSTLVSNISSEYSANTLTMLAGSVSDGVFTDTRYQLARTVILSHDRPWIMEWKGTGKGGVMLAADSVATTGDPFFFRRQANQLFAFGIYEGGRFNNYGITLPESLDTTQEHIYRLENRIDTDGINMVYLFVDGVQIGALNNHFVGGAAQGTTSDWISGQDILINYFGTQSHPLTDMSLTYLRIEEDTSIHHHSYTPVVTEPTYTSGGYTTYTCSCGDSYVSDYTDAIALYSYRWEMDNNTMVSVDSNGNTANSLTLDSGSVANGTFSKARYSLQTNVQLHHDVPWAMEWRSTGNWSGMLFGSTAQSPSDGLIYLFRDSGSKLIAFGEYTGSWNNYGIVLNCDMTVSHLFRLENRVAADGSNAVYLLVDGEEIGAMDHHYVAGTNQNSTVNWANGKEITFGSIGTSSHPMSGMKLDYLQIWEMGHSHSYQTAVTAPTCTEKGYTTYTCACGSSYVSDNVDALGHTYDNGSCTLCGASAPSAYAGKTIACIGDSITYGVGVTRDQTDYVTLLAKSLEMDYIRLGASGTTLCTDGHATCNIGKLTEANLAGADVVTVLMGINDFVQAKSGYYSLGTVDSTDTSTIYGATHMWCRRIVELRKTDSLKNTEFYFMTPVITSWNNSVSSVRNWDQGKTNIHGYTLRDLCNVVIEVCALYDIPVIDLNLISGLYYNSPEDNNIDKFGGDGAHPGAVGHQMMADAIENALLKNHLRDDHDHSYGSWITTTYPDCEDGEQQRVCTICTATESQVQKGTGHNYTSGICTVCGEAHPNLANFAGKVISVMGDSISTFAGYIPVADGYNREHLARYPQDNLLTDVNETWWMQVVAELDAKLGINESWRGSTLSGAVPVTTGDTGENAAMSNLIRIQNMGSNGTPNVILLYGGTNDLAHVNKVGTFDPATAPTQVDLTTAKWDNLADGFVHTLIRMRHFYPDATILALLPTYTASYYSDEKLAQGNAVMAQICEHYGIPYVDLRDSGVTASHLPDGIHPGEEGMDLITEAVLDQLLQQSIEPGENVVFPVTHELTHVTASLGHYKGISAGEPFVESLTGENMTVTVTMDGVEITDECYKNDKITIDAITGALVITAQGKYSLDDHLQQLPDIYCGVNLWQALERDPQYYSADGWATHSSGKVKSITFPVVPGDRLWASSFGEAGTNGGTMNGIRVTYFAEDGLLKSMTAAQVYSEFTENGCLMVPEGAIAISIPMWTDSEEWDVHFLCVLDGHLQSLPENTCGKTNLWPMMDKDSQYYTANGWETHSSGKVKSVTFRVNPGEKLLATSFGKSGTNGGSTNGIRVTWFTQCGVLESVSAGSIYQEFTENGYITVPEGVWAVCVPMWNDSDQNELYILNREHISVTDPAVAATCTDTGLTEGSHCAGCGEVLTAQEIVSALDHSYEDHTCIRCGAAETSTFQILDTRCNCIETFTYEVGMTWKQWLNSSYNTGMGSVIAIWVSEGPDILGSNPNMDIYVNGSPIDYRAVICEEDDLQLVRYN